MRTLHSMTVALLAVVLVGACDTAPLIPATSLQSSALPAASAPRPVSVASSEPSVLSPTEAPRLPAEWPFRLDDVGPVVGSDGTVFALVRDPGDLNRRVITALDAGGRQKAGWPIGASRGSQLGEPTAGSDGSLFVEERGPLGVGNVVHRFDAAGRDLPGWPYLIPADQACPSGPPFETDDPRTPAADDPCYPVDITAGPDATVYIRTGGRTRPRIHAVDAAGTVRPGWPIALDEADWYPEQVGPDGSLYLVRRPAGTPTWSPTRGLIDDGAELWAFDPNGLARSGWPVPVPNISEFVIGPTGDIVVRSLLDDLGELCREPQRTVFTVHGPDGRVRPGWPRGSTGFASMPVMAGDGTIHYVSATGRVYAHDHAGQVKTGWPVEVAGAGSGCGPEQPHLGPDGTIYVVGDEVVAVSPGGDSPAGWPIRLSGPTIGPCLDTECFGGHGAPVFGPDGTVYLIVFRGTAPATRAEIVALDARGDMKPGWPYRLPFDPDTGSIGLMTITADGRLLISVGSGPDLLLSLDPDGTVSD